MRLTSALWVSALIRRCNGAGIAAFVTGRGAEQAGAIFIVVDRLDGSLDLYAPAPQTDFDEARPADRRFERVLERAGQEDVTARLDSEKRFDPDVWVVTIEDRDDRELFEISGGAG